MSTATTNATTTVLENHSLKEVFNKVQALAAKAPVDIYFTGVMQQLENGGDPIRVCEPILVKEVWPTEFVVELCGFYEWALCLGNPKSKAMFMAVPGSQTATNRFEIVPKGQLPTLGTLSDIDVKAIWPDWYERLMAAKEADDAEVRLRDLLKAGDLQGAILAQQEFEAANARFEALMDKLKQAAAAEAEAAERAAAEAAAAKAAKEQEKQRKAEEKAAKAKKQQASALLNSELGRALLKKRSNDLDMALAACSDLHAKIVAAAEAVDLELLKELKAQRPVFEAAYNAAEANLTQEALLKALSDPEAVQAELDGKTEQVEIEQTEQVEIEQIQIDVVVEEAAPVKPKRTRTRKKGS